MGARFDIAMPRAQLQLQEVDGSLTRTMLLRPKETMDDFRGVPRMQLCFSLVPGDQRGVHWA